MEAIDEAIDGEHKLFGYFRAKNILHYVDGNEFVVVWKKDQTATNYAVNLLWGHALKVGSSFPVMDMKSDIFLY